MLVQILTKNNETTIKKTLDSISDLDAVIVDYGSSDNTIEIIKSYGIIPTYSKKPKHEIRNGLKHSETNLYLEPWESLINVPEGDSGYVKVIQEKQINKEIRFWHGQKTFINPVYEKLNIETDVETNGIIYCHGEPNYQELKEDIDLWIKNCPTLSKPYYYKACIELNMGKIEEFMLSAAHYLFLDNTSSMHSIMTRFYYSMCLMMSGKNKSALQNINLCLCAKPLMSEFWCLMADVFYNLNQFSHAKCFYENAIFLGKRRMNSDKFPMNIEKYREYPERMIKNCNEILNQQINIIRQGD